MSLLNAILKFEEGKRINDLEIVENQKLDKDRIEDKQGILDIRARLKDGTRINIEVQLVNQFNMNKRTLFYWSKLYAEQINPGDGFGVLNKTITINILDFNHIDLEKYHTTFHLREDERNDYRLTDTLEVHFIELPKFRRNKPDIDKPLERWLMFMETSSEEVLEMLRDKDPSIKKAEDILDWLGNDEETVRQYERREMQIHDEITRIQGAQEEGRVKERQEIILNMLNQNIDISIIHSVTKATIEEINKIKDSLN